MITILIALSGALLTPREEVIVLEPERTDYLLAFPQIVYGSLDIEGLDSLWVLHGDTLHLVLPFPETLTVTARYLTLDEQITSPHRINPPSSQSRFLPQDTAGARKGIAAPGENLEVHGAKTFSLEVTNKGSNDIDQGLSVDVSGQLAEVDVTAHLADEQGSFVPSGTTERIEDFDRIAIGLSQDSWSLGLGDLDLSYPVSGYGEIERRFEGATGEVTLRNFQSRASLGLEGTRRGHVILSPKDGKSGPYWIGDRSSEQPLVPGSERVWLDGSLLVRGADRDYTIDYLTGELFFSNRTPIDANSKIEVDYTYAGSDYRSNNQLVASGYGPVKVFFYREADARLNEFHTWSQEQQAVLDTARAGAVILPGGSFVGAGKGNYLYENGHYVWVGFGEGEYDVSFRWVESGGDYLLDADSGFYRYVGPDSGDYRAEILTLLPNREEVTGVSFEHTFGAISVVGMALGSRITPNLYNPDRWLFGHAHKITTGLEFGKISLVVSHRLQLPQTWIPASGADVDARDRWNLDSFPTSFNEQKASISAMPLDSLRVTLEAGHLWSSVHKFYAALSSRARFYSVSTDWLEDRQRASLNLNPRFGIFFPMAGASFENYNIELRRSLEPSLGLRVEPLSSLQMKASVSRRIDQVHPPDGSWLDTLYYDRLTVTADWDGNKLNASATAGAERQIPKGSTADSTWHTFFADFRSYWSPNSKIRINAELSQHLVQTSSIVYQYVPVEPGTGDYKRDPQTGEYVPGENGDYIRVEIVDDAAGLGVTRSAILGADLRFDLVTFWASLAYEDEAPSHSLLASARLTLLPSYQPLSVIIYPSYKNQSLPAWGAMEERITGWGTSVELRSRVHPDYQVRLEGSASRQDRDRGGVPLRSRTEYEAALSPILELWLTLEPEVGFGRLLADEPFYFPELGEIIVSRVWVGSQAQKRLGLWRITAGATLISRQSSIAAEVLPYLITQDDPPGLEPSWSFGLERSFNISGENLSLRASYQGKLYPDERGLENSFQLSAGMYF